MVAVIVTLQIDMFVTSCYTRRHYNKDSPKEAANNEDQEAGGAAHADHLHLHKHANHGHAHPTNASA